MQKDTAFSGLANFVLLAALFNLFLLFGENHIAISWLYSQYFLSYADEFVKRGLVGTLFYAAGFVPSDRSILTLSLAASNIFFALFYLFSRRQMAPLSEQAFMPLMVLFIVSPAVAMHLGLDTGRFDHLNLVLTMVALIALVQGGWTAYIFVPLAMVAGILVHEAFVFISAPLLMAVTYNEIRKDRYGMGLLLTEAVAIAVPLTCILIWGNITPETFHRVYDQTTASFPGYNHIDPLTIWISSLRENLAFTMEYAAKPEIEVQILLALPFLIANFLLYRSMLGPARLDRSQRLVYLSPLALLLMFVLGSDFFRWIALCVIMMFMAFAYLAHEVNPAALKTPSLRDRALLIFIGLHTFLGPIGVNLHAFYVPGRF